MIMVKEAWKAISPTTIKNCWDHTGIQRAPLPPVLLRRNAPLVASTPSALSLGWHIVVEFASERWTVPQVHDRLGEYLGDKYSASDWDEPLDAILNAEDDVEEALKALESLRSKRDIDSPDSSGRHAATEQCTELEEDLKGLIDQLKEHKCIIGDPLNLEEFLDPKEERQVGDSPYRFDRGDAEIVAQVRNGMAKEQEVIEIDSESDEEPNEPQISTNEVLQMCQKLEHVSISVCEDENMGLEVAKMLRRFMGEVKRQ